MSQRKQVPPPSPLRANIVCQGDSLTDPAGLVPAFARWTEGLQKRLEAAGASVVVRNIAQSGARTDDGGTTGGSGKQMLYRFMPFGPDALRPIKPDIAILWGGTNDWRSVSSLTSSGTTATATVTGHGWSTGMLADVLGATPSGYNVEGVSLTSTNANTLTFPVASGLSSPATGTITLRLQTQRNLRAMIKWVRFGCIGAYRSEADLPASGQPGDRYVVLYDTSSTGGVAAGSGQTTTVTGSVSSDDPTVWEYRNGRAGVAGWGRIAKVGTAYDSARGCNRIIVVGNHYLNYSSGGDTVGTPLAVYDDVSGIRSQQAAAATAEGVVFANLYNFLKARIQAGTDTQGDYAWHYADSNIHLNAYGNDLVAELLYQTIAAQSGWVSALTT